MKKWIIAALIGFSSLPGIAQQTVYTYTDNANQSVNPDHKTGASVVPDGSAILLHAQLHRREQTTGMNTLQERSVNENAAGFNTQLVLGYLVNNQHRIIIKKPGEKISWASLD